MAVVTQAQPNIASNEEEDKQKGQNPFKTIGTTTPAGQSPAGTPVANSMANSLANRSGSGRFTNIQKYLGANKQSGQQMGQQVSQGINKGLTEQQQKAESYATRLGKSITSAQGAIGRGQGYQKDLQGIGQQIGSNEVGSVDSDNFKKWLKSSKDINGFLDNGQPDYTYYMPESPNRRINPDTTPKTREELYKEYQQEMLASRPEQKLSAIEDFTKRKEFQDFLNVQAGRGVDESLMELQKRKAAAQAQQSRIAAQEAAKQIGTETGRFDLLRKTFGGAVRPGYTSGQQRLDQMLLGQSGALSGVRSNINQQARLADQQIRNVGGQANEVNRIAGQEQGLTKAIADQAKQNEQSYINMLASYGQSLQDQRNQEYTQLGEAFGSYVPTSYDEKTGKYLDKPYSPGLNADQMARLGLDANTGVYNFFKDKTYMDALAKDPQELAKFFSSKGQEVRLGEGNVATAQDVANAQDVARYKALRSIMGESSPGQIYQESQIGNAYDALQGDQSLAARLAERDAAFNELKVGGKAMSGYYSSSADINDLINQGRNVGIDPVQYNPNLGISINYNNPRLEEYKKQNPNATMADIREFLKKDLEPEIRENMYQNLQDMLARENYNQTIGGRRETFLDTENFGKVPGQTSTLNPVPVTGTDPSLGYGMKGNK